MMRGTMSIPKKLCKNQTAVKCPQCKSTNHEGEVEFVETIPSCRSIHGIVNGTIYIDEVSEECWDDAYNATLHCRNCGHNWGLPWDQEFVVDREFQRVSGTTT